MSRHTITRLKPRKRVNGVERWFLDIETWRLNARNFAFCVLKNWNGDVTRVFYDVEEAKDFLHTRPMNVLVYAHNCWKFDGLAFYTVEELMPASRLVAGNRIISMTLNLESGHTIEWRDTVALMPIGIAKLGDSLGLPKGETPIDYIKGNRREITPEDVEYCVRDVEILRQSIRQLDDSFNEWCEVPHGTYELPPTGASLAYRVWCKKYWPKEWSSFVKRRSRGKKTKGQVLLDENGNPKKDRIDRAFCEARANETLGFAYYGGRTQVICEPGLLQELVHSIDGNSLFLQPCSIHTQISQRVEVWDVLNTIYECFFRMKTVFVGRTFVWLLVMTHPFFSPTRPLMVAVNGIREFLMDGYANRRSNTH